MNIRTERGVGHSYLKLPFFFLKMKKRGSKKASNLSKAPVMNQMFVVLHNSEIEALVSSVTLFGDRVRLSEVIKGWAVQ